MIAWLDARITDYLVKLAHRFYDDGTVDKVLRKRAG
jgi:hypothetical protein